jgi:hypothetical protein
MKARGKLRVKDDGIYGMKAKIRYNSLGFCNIRFFN